MAETFTCEICDQPVSEDLRSTCCHAETCRDCEEDSPCRECLREDKPWDDADRAWDAAKEETWRDGAC